MRLRPTSALSRAKREVWPKGNTRTWHNTIRYRVCACSTKRQLPQRCHIGELDSARLACPHVERTRTRCLVLFLRQVDLWLISSLETPCTMTGARHVIGRLEANLRPQKHDRAHSRLRGSQCPIKAAQWRSRDSARKIPRTLLGFIQNLLIAVVCHTHLHFIY